MTLELITKVAIVPCLSLAILYLDAFFQAQKGSILYCLAKVLSLFEVSAVSDLIRLGILKMTLIDVNAVFALSDEKSSKCSYLPQVA